MKRNPKSYWTIEACKVEALKYTSKGEFAKNSMSAYNAAIRLNCLDNITTHMIRPIVHNHLWLKENCAEEALKYTCRNDFRKRSGGCYAAARKNGWLNDITTHMTRPTNYNKIWDEENCRTEATKYSLRKDFIAHSKGAYLAARKLGILDEVCVHMNICGSLMRRVIYAYEFSDNCVYVGLTYNADLRYLQHLSHKKSAVYRHINKTGLNPRYKILTDNYVDVHLAQKLEKKFIEQYKNSNWVILNKAQAGGIGWVRLPENRKEEKI